MKVHKILFVSGLCVFLITSMACSQRNALKDHVLFYSSFDNKTAANVYGGDAQLYTAKNYKEATSARPGLHNPDVVIAKGKGLVGDALHFKKANTSAIFYKAYKNVGYSRKSWSATVSFWLQLDPNNDLAPGYCDPISITDSRFDDAALWVDFTDDTPRKFRFGALGDTEAWNPENKYVEAEVEKRTVTVKRPPFEEGKWTHIAISFSKVNTAKSVFKLYLDGQYMGVVKDVNDPFSWEAENGKIMLGLGYVGFMDELSIFNKSLDSDEVNLVYKLKNGIKTLLEGN